MNSHHCSLTELENMIPWERHVFLDLLRQHIEEENERMKAEHHG